MNRVNPLAEFENPPCALDDGDDLPAWYYYLAAFVWTLTLAFSLGVYV